MSSLSRLAVPFVYTLIFFLGYPTQWLLLRLEPAPLTKKQLITANIVLVLIWITYTRSVWVDPGRVPKGWGEKEGKEEEEWTGKGKGAGNAEWEVKSRKWCRKCNAAKPPRAHHCKECKRCIPKMDHHCPWTSNCVSHTTFPHFLRFLFYATLGLSLFESHLFTRLLHLWHTRDLPISLGPSLPQLTLLFAAFAANSFTLFLLAILLVRNLWSLAVNTTTIEAWEISRHETLVRRARHFGGYLSSPSGIEMRITRQEFPYDVGIWANIVAGMGSANPINWMNPFSATPSVDTGLVFETNGFESADKVWPPPDPDRAFRRRDWRREGGPEEEEGGKGFTFRDEGLSNEESVRAFRERQAVDVVRRRRPFVERVEGMKGSAVGKEREVYEGDGYAGYTQDYDQDDAGAYSDGSEELTDVARKPDGNDPEEGEESWRNSEGERLKDFGVDEDVEFYDEQEDEIPLSELLARRKAAASVTGSSY